MISVKTDSGWIYSDISQSSINRECCAVLYKKIVPEVTVTPETEQVKTPDVNVSTDGTVPGDQSDGRNQLSAPQRKTGTDPLFKTTMIPVHQFQSGTESLFKMTTLLFSTLWILTLITLVIGGVIFYDQKSYSKIELNDKRINLTCIQKAEVGKVAFSASLRRMQQVTLGPYKKFVILVYKNIYINIGNAYSETTGFFKAPVRGAYEFSFTSFGWSNNIPSGVNLYRNDVYVTGAYDNNPGPGRGTALSIALQLDAGDIIYLGLPAGMRVHDNTNHYNMFSGHMLFVLCEECE